MARNKRTSPSRRPSGQQRLRIIGGDWRGRKLEFPDLPGLRPTPDRVRETLFNWLQSTIAGAHCLDLFAGSGALGLEALSRGAASVQFVDNNPTAIDYLQRNLQLLKAENSQCIRHNALDWIPQASLEPIDLIFLDPPFRQNLLAPCCALLAEQDWLREGALIYLEAENELQPLPVPAQWQLLKQKTAGQLTSYLFKNVKSL